MDFFVLKPTWLASEAQIISDNDIILGWVYSRGYLHRRVGIKAPNPKLQAPKLVKHFGIWDLVLIMLFFIKGINIPINTYIISPCFKSGYIGSGSMTFPF